MCSIDLHGHLLMEIQRGTWIVQSSDTTPFWCILNNGNGYRDDPTIIVPKWVDSAADEFQAKYHAAYNERLVALRAEIGEDVGEVPREQQIVIFYALTPLNAKGRAYPGGNLPDTMGSSMAQRRRMMMNDSNCQEYDSTIVGELEAKLIAMQDETDLVKARGEETSRLYEERLYHVEEECRQIGAPTGQREL